MSSTNQRKRRTAAPSSSRRRVKVSRAASMQAEPAPPARDTVHVLESSTANDEEDVVDLTCEGSEPAPVVDLTNNDSVVLVDEAPEVRGGADSESYVLSSDEEDSTTALNSALLSSLQASSRARSTPGTISCPVCMDAYAEIVESGRLVVSTKCGHIFCSQCLRDSLSRSHSCPTCRNKLTHKQYHPIYI